MKKLILIIFVALMGCKKQEITPEVFDITLNTEIWRYDNYAKYSGLDSVKYDLYRTIDSALVSSGYTGTNGTIQLSLAKGTEYTLATKTRTYERDNNLYYYSSIERFYSSRTAGGENYKQKGWTIYYHYPNDGMGSTYTAEPDPCFK